MSNPEIIVALDVPFVSEAEDLVSKIGASWYKIGPELAFADGARDFCRALPNVFLDLKLSDIPTTIARTVRQLIRTWDPRILSVRSFPKIAQDEADKAGILIAHVPSLTCDLKGKFAVTPARAIVCRPSLVPFYRRNMSWAKIIIPGVRLKPGSDDDHAETSTPSLDADFFVVGRPITRAKDPRKAFEKFKSYIGESDALV